LGKPTGVLYLPDLHRLFVACGDDGNVRVFDSGTLEHLKTISGLEDADNMRWDVQAGRIYVGYAAGALGVIDAAKAEMIRSIPLAGHPESFQLEKGGARIFANVPDAGHVAVVDRKRGLAIATWPMTGFSANFPMALDEIDQRLFIGYRNPARLLVLDTASGRKVVDLPLSGDIDDLFYEAATRRLYASCGEGFIDVFVPKSKDLYERTERIATAPGARTAFYSPERKEFYLAVPDRGAQKAEIRICPAWWFWPSAATRSGRFCLCSAWPSASGPWSAWWPSARGPRPGSGIRSPASARTASGSKPVR
jgi:hypothetical protein